jgi:hypothetical protein
MLLCETLSTLKSMFDGSTVIRDDIQTFAPDVGEVLLLSRRKQASEFAA